jgi:hypothetical protein
MSSGSSRLAAASSSRGASLLRLLQVTCVGRPPCGRAHQRMAKPHSRTEFDQARFRGGGCRVRRDTEPPGGAPQHGHVAGRLDRSGEKQRLTAGDQVHGHSGERDRQLLDPRRQPGPRDQPTQAAIGEDADPRGRVAEREHVTAPQLGPHAVQPRRGHAGVGGRDGPVEGTHRGSDDQVWDESALLQRVPDTNLRRPEHTTAAHHCRHGTGKSAPARRLPAIGRPVRRRGTCPAVARHGSGLLSGNAWLRTTVTATAAAATRATIAPTPAPAPATGANSTRVAAPSRMDGRTRDRGTIGA